MVTFQNKNFPSYKLGDKYQLILF